MFITYIDWEQQKSNKIFKPLSKKGFEKLPVLSVTQDDGVIKRSDLNMDIKYTTASLHNYKLIEPHNFVISLRSFQGGFELSDITGVVSPAYTIFSFKENNNQDELFWKYKFKTHNFIQSLKTITFGIRDGKSISFSEFKSLPLVFPNNKKEQKEIGKSFIILEKMIMLEREKLNLYEGIKKYMLQNLFPSDGESVPAVRIADFHEDWEQHKLSDLGEIYTGNTPSTNQHDFWSINANGYVWITPSDIVKLRTNSSKKHLTERGWKEARTVPAQSVLITSIASIGKNTINTIPAAFNQQINAIVPKGNNANFILESMNFHSGKFASLAGKTATAIINKKQFSKFQIYVPSYVEQLEVGRLISKLNQTIDFYREKIIMYEKIKKYYLQKLFI